MKKPLIMKFGGASLASPVQFDIIADLILKRAQIYPNIVIVVSAMGQTTNDLIALAQAVNATPPQREYDMLLSVGERISMALLAMAIAKKNFNAISFTGSQSGIVTTSDHTEAKIVEVRPTRILKSLESNKLVIVAGFQGVSIHGEITTLGRGGSDTTAVALGIALDAEKVEFYKDVPGIFSSDPKCDTNAQLLPTMSYDEAIAIASTGAKILHQRSLFLAKANQIPLHVLSFKEESCLGTVIQDTTTTKQIHKIYEIGGAPHAVQP